MASASEKPRFGGASILYTYDNRFFIPFSIHAIASVPMNARLTHIRTMNIATSAQQDRSIIGTVHRFGRNGILYEVLREIDDRSAVIRVIETGEETIYPITDIRSDPTE
jgi:hypothetical protein